MDKCEICGYKLSKTQIEDKKPYCYYCELFYNGLLVAMAATRIFFIEKAPLRTPVDNEDTMKRLIKFMKLIKF
jgi:hypothetical protein